MAGAPHTVCRTCRSVTAGVHTRCRAPTRVPGYCNSVDTEFHETATLADAAAAGMWLADGYSMCDVADPYFRPRR